MAKTRKIEPIVVKRKPPKQTGTYLQSEMMRVDRDFAQYVREQARAGEIPATQVTREIWESLQ